MAETRSGNRQEIVGKLTANGLKLSKNGPEASSMVRKWEKIVVKWPGNGIRRSEMARKQS